MSHWELINNKYVLVKQDLIVSSSDLYGLDIIASELYMGIWYVLIKCKSIDEFNYHKNIFLEREHTNYDHTKKPTYYHISAVINNDVYMTHIYTFEYIKYE